MHLMAGLTPVKPVLLTCSSSCCCWASMQPFTLMTMQSTTFSTSWGTSKPTHWTRHTAQEARHTVHKMQSSQQVFSLSNRVWMRKRLAEIAQLVQQNASAHMQFWSCGSLRGPQGNMPPQHTYGSPMTSRMSPRCLPTMQQQQQHPARHQCGALMGASKRPICHFPVSCSTTSCLIGIPLLLPRPPSESCWPRSRAAGVAAETSCGA
mmetsp:Transcript_91818/g.249178  ORF Transcript_91818/g.249178 Transcript_91818/m.249178 type:complete len:207 (-) Transcript_91818:7-627(-)